MVQQMVIPFSEPFYIAMMKQDCEAKIFDKMFGWFGNDDYSNLRSDIMGCIRPEA